MNFNRYTIKSQELLQHASQIALGNQQPIIETGHLVKALLEIDENTINFLFQKCGASKSFVKNKVDELITTYPKSSGESPYLSNEAAAALQRAERYL
ncbi:MAG: type VI secretion system ATPase TssH, partial [Raineya sp.]|nr:type VI secretion system ATPase TssH [Raineya sp.]